MAVRAASGNGDGDSGFWQNTRRSFSVAVRHHGFGVIALIALVLVILGPLYSVILWAFAERWRYPSLIPTEFGLRFWEETFSRADILKALPFSIVLATTVTALSALICLPAAYAF